MNEELKKQVIDLLEYAKTNKFDKIIEYVCGSKFYRKSS